MPRTPAAAPADHQPDPPAPGLRPVPAGYDLDTLPLHQDIRPGESVASWLRRLANRYGIAPRGLLAECGAKRPPATNRSLTRYLARKPELGRRLGLGPLDIKVLTARPALETATDHYLRSFQRTLARPQRVTSRYCPACLAAPDPYWPAHWHSPLSLICPDHGQLLATTCPDCGTPPLGSGSWLSKPLAPWDCASRIQNPATRARKVRPICQGDLRRKRTVPATDDQHLAQLLLAEFATHPQQEPRACGVTITGRIGFHAMVELIDARLEDEAPYLDLATDPADVVEALAEALTIVRQPTLADAAEAAFHLLSPRRRHAPIGPASTVRARPHNPLLVAIQLTRLGGR